MSQEKTEYAFVDDSATLDELIEQISPASVFALDTEFIRERTYYPELCVLQIATAEVVAAVDCLAAIDLEPLYEILLSPGKSWLLHSARQDLEVLFNRTGKLPEKLIDTQIAASLIGMPLQIGLQGLLEEILNVEIGKQHTRANWKRRPLPEAFLSYALDDVRYLIPACKRLKDRLRALGRLNWFDEECDRQLHLPIEPDTETIFDRTKGTGKLRGRSRAVARALVAWREERAKSRDKPRRWILADDELVRIAMALPATESELERVPDLPPKLVSRSGIALVAAIREAPELEDRAESPIPDKAILRALQSEVKSRADELGIQPELLATRRDIAMLAIGQLPESVASGWRGPILAELKDLISRDRAS
jgi:ribonuclease D